MKIQCLYGGLNLFAVAKMVPFWRCSSKKRKND